MKYFLLLTLLINTAFAQVFVSQETKTEFKFQGTLIKEAIHRKGIMTIREVSGKQNVLLVLEVKDFKLGDVFQEEEFNEVFMESQYFPQIRVTGDLAEKIDLTKDGTYMTTLRGRFTMRMIPVLTEIKMKMTIKNGEMFVNFEKEIDLTDYNVSYAGQGSAIGRTAPFVFTGKLKRTF